MSEAGGRDRENYRFHSQLRDLYGIAARKFSQRKREYEKLALESAVRAYALNPAKGEIGVAYGRLLMADGQVERGLGVYRKVVEDERRCLQQQQEMFGSGRRLTGRLSEEVMEELEEALRAGGIGTTD